MTTRIRIQTHTGTVQMHDTSVSEPKRLFQGPTPDPDPTFQIIPYPDPRSGSGSGCRLFSMYYFHHK
jgi:hypothetical protein